MGTRYHHYDGLGSTQLLTDESGNVTDSYVNTAFGEPVDTGAANPTVNPFRFVGREGYYLDVDTGSYYVRARDLSPVLARWLSQDPIGFASSGAIPGSNCKTVFGDAGDTGTEYPTHDPFLFLGQQGYCVDTVTGNSYVRERDYSRMVARQLSEDPIGLVVGDMNAYQYVSNSPAGGIDPSGLWTDYEVAYSVTWPVQCYVCRIPGINGFFPANPASFFACDLKWIFKFDAAAAADNEIQTRIACTQIGKCYAKYW